MKLNSKQREELATEIFEWLYANKLWTDVCIYFNGKCWSSNAKDNKEFCYNEHRYFEYEANPKDYFEYVAEPNILSMSFEGGLYEVINYDYEFKHWAELLNEFNQIFLKYSLYFELGNAWNLTAYEIGR